MLPSDMEGLWLDRGVDDPIALADVLSPHLADTMDTYEVSALVNSVANDGPEVIEASGGTRQQLTANRRPPVGRHYIVAPALLVAELPGP